VSSYEPMKSRTPTGTTPNASRKSTSLKPAATTRSGACSIVVSPNSCSMVTGNAPAAGSVAATVPEAVAVAVLAAVPVEVAVGSSSSPPQAARNAAAAAAAVVPARKRRRESERDRTLGASVMVLSPLVRGACSSGRRSGRRDVLDVGRGVAIQRRGDLRHDLLEGVRQAQDAVERERGIRVIADQEVALLLGDRKRRVHG